MRPVCVTYCCVREICAFDSSCRWYVMRVTLSSSSVGAIVLSLSGKNTVDTRRY